MCKICTMGGGMMKDKEAEVKKVWNSLDEDTKLAVTQYIFTALVAHAESGGSYRHLIYGRLGFSNKAYSYLYPEGMIISNHFEIPEGE